MYERMMNEARSIAGTARTEKDMYSRVKRVHDILAGRSSYNYASLNAPASSMMFIMAHSAYSGMFEDQYEPVCEGYAKALKIILNMLDIPCVLAVSDSHMWNNVKMDDGLWYNVDLTWNDSGDRDRHDYFLVGSGTQIGSAAFSSSHKEVDPITNKAGSARYPKKNTVAYKYIGEDYPPLTYPDVPRTDYAYEYIEKVSKLGYFSGDTSGNFNPGKKITRAEFVSLGAEGGRLAVRRDVQLLRRGHRQMVLRRGLLGQGERHHGRRRREVQAQRSHIPPGDVLRACQGLRP